MFYKKKGVVFPIFYHGFSDHSRQPLLPLIPVSRLLSVCLPRLVPTVASPCQDPCCVLSRKARVPRDRGRLSRIQFKTALFLHGPSSCTLRFGVVFLIVVEVVLPDVFQFWSRRWRTPSSLGVPAVLCFYMLDFLLYCGSIG